MLSSLRHLHTHAFCVSLMRQIYYWRESLVSEKRRRRAIPTFASSTNVTGGGTQSYTVTELKPYTRYTIAVTAYNSVGDGPESAEVIAFTSETGKVVLVFKGNYRVFQKFVPIFCSLIFQ